jgi:hypothetical protein
VNSIEINPIQSGGKNAPGRPSAEIIRDPDHGPACLPARLPADEGVVAVSVVIDASGGISRLGFVCSSFFF